MGSQRAPSIASILAWHLCHGRPLEVDDGDDVEAGEPIRACEICHLVNSTVELKGDVDRRCDRLGDGSFPPQVVWAPCASVVDLKIVDHPCHLTSYLHRE